MSQVGQARLATGEREPGSIASDVESLASETVWIPGLAAPSAPLARDDSDWPSGAAALGAERRLQEPELAPDRIVV